MQLPHVNQLVQSTLWKKHGINEIIWLIGRTAIGMYKPRHKDQEHLMSVVLYWLGGACVAEFAHAALSMPSLSTTWWHCTILIHATLIFPTIEQLTINIVAAYQINTPSSNDITGVVCMFDEIKVEELLDWCPAMNRWSDFVENIQDRVHQSSIILMMCMLCLMIWWRAESTLEPRCVSHRNKFNNNLSHKL